MANKKSDQRNRFFTTYLEELEKNEKQFVFVCATLNFHHIFNACTREGFLSNCAKVLKPTDFEACKSPNAIAFENFFTTLLDTLNKGKPSMIIMNSASYTTRRQGNRLVTEKLAEERGHTILRLPSGPQNTKYNLMKIIWKNVCKEVRKNNYASETDKDKLKLLFKSMKMISETQWEACVNELDALIRKDAEQLEEYAVQRPLGDPKPYLEKLKVALDNNKNQIVFVGDTFKFYTTYVACTFSNFVCYDTYNKQSNTLENKSSENFKQWFKEYLLKQLPNNSIIIMNNAYYHDLFVIDQLAKNNGHTLLRLPPGRENRKYNFIQLILRECDKMYKNQSGSGFNIWNDCLKEINWQTCSERFFALVKKQLYK